MRAFAVAFLAILVFGANILSAAEITESFPGGDEGFYEGGSGDIIFSATKTPRRLVEAPAIATVITASEIWNMGARTLSDIFKNIPGIVMLAVKELGNGYDTLEVRGIATLHSEKILVMIDGHSVNNLLSGGAAMSFYDMTVENIKRVEIIRGPGSAMHGNSAFVASINVVTKTTADVNGIEFTAGAGTFDTKHADILFGGEFSGLTVTGMFDYLENGSPGLHVEQDAFGGSGKTDNWRRKYDFGLTAEHGDFVFRTRYAERTTGAYIGVLNAVSDESEMRFSHLFGELVYQRAIDDNWNALAKVYADRFTNKFYWEAISEGVVPAFPDGLVGVPLAKDRTFGGEIQIDYTAWKGNTVTFGAMYEDKKQYDVRHETNFHPLTGAPLGGFQDITEWGNWNKDEVRSIAAFYLQDVWQITKALEGTFGVRYDNYSDFGNTANPRAALVWNISGNTNVKLLYGSAFRAPNFEELYNQNNPAHTGNPDLKPEKITTYEVSVSYFPKDLSIDVTYFNSVIDDIIIWREGFSGNFNKWKVDGIEMAAKAHFGPANYVYVNYTRQDPRDADTDERLPEVPTSYGNVGANWEIGGHVNLNANLFVTGPRSRANEDTRPELPGYQVVDLTMIVKNFFETAEFRLSAHNLLDEEYADPAPVNSVASDFPRPGVSILAEVRWRR